MKDEYDFSKGKRGAFFEHGFYKSMVLLIHWYYIAISFNIALTSNCYIACQFIELYFMAV